MPEVRRPRSGPDERPGGPALRAGCRRCRAPGRRGRGRGDRPEDRIEIQAELPYGLIARETCRRQTLALLIALQSLARLRIQPAGAVFGGQESLGAEPLLYLLLGPFAHQAH